LKYLKVGSEEEMVAIFLKAELDSPRFSKLIKKNSKKFNVPLSVIEHPDLRDSNQNQQRSKILTSYRGWGTRTKMFENFPSKLRWEWWELNKSDVLNLCYVDYSYWNELSRGSHLVKDGVQTVRDGVEIYGVSNQQYLDLAQKIDKNASLPPLILDQARSEGRLEIIEGHVRATAFGLSKQKNITVKALIGKNRGEL
jgi:hypothetical protein